MGKFENGRFKERISKTFSKDGKDSVNHTEKVTPIEQAINLILELLEKIEANTKK